MGDTQSVKITIPEHLGDIKLGKYKEFILNADEENGDQLALLFLWVRWRYAGGYEEEGSG